MMTGRLYIDGKDAYTEYGMYVVEGGWNELIAWAPLKTPEYNEWQEEDGIEADLSDPRLNTKEASVKFATPKLMGDYLKLLEVISDEAYHTFDCRSIGRIFKLRLTSQPSIDKAQDFGFVALKFAVDNPLEGYEYTAPQSNLPENDDYTLDGRPLSYWGVFVLKGTMAEVLKTANVKPNLLRNIKSKSGAQYDPKTVTYKSKDVKINCLMRAETLTQLWRNYDALLYDLIRPEERNLEANDIAEGFPCYYKSCTVNTLYTTGKIWLDFTITLTFTRDFRISTEPLLATEDGLFVVTEDYDENEYITLKPDKQE